MQTTTDSMANDEDPDVKPLMCAVQQECTDTLKKDKAQKQKITELEDENTKLKKEQEKMKADNKGFSEEVMQTTTDYIENDIVPDQADEETSFSSLLESFTAQKQRIYELKDVITKLKNELEKMKADNKEFSEEAMQTMTDDMANCGDPDVEILMDSPQENYNDLRNRYEALQYENTELKKELEKMKADNKDNSTVPGLLPGRDDRQQDIMTDNKKKEISHGLVVICCQANFNSRNLDRKGAYNGVSELKKTWESYDCKVMGIISDQTNSFYENELTNKKFHLEYDPNGNLLTKLYDKGDHFNFKMINFHHIWWFSQCLHSVHSDCDAMITGFYYYRLNALFYWFLSLKVEHELKQIQDMKLFVFILCTHGEEALVVDQKRNVNVSEHFFCTRDGKMKTQDLITNIGAIVDLKEKLKVFIIQACRSGSNKQRDIGYELKLNNVAVTQKPQTATDENATSGVQCDGDIENPPQPTDDGIIESIPHCDSCIVLFASMPGKEAYRSETDGGWLITALAKALTGYEKDKVPILDLFTMVNSEIAKKEYIKDEVIYKCQSCFYYNIAFPVQDLVFVKKANDKENK